MLYLSTAGSAPPVSLRQALFAGPAPDGGLYVPERLPPLSPAEVRRLAGCPFPEVALAVARRLLAEDLAQGVLERVVVEALDFPIPLVELDERRFVLELFHGPTLAFKDVGARFMARLMAHFGSGEDRALTVLAATSGDTGSAVAHAFHGLDGFSVVVLFPRGQVSVAQQRLFTTLGGNVSAVSVAGTFDDCQRLVRRAFADESLRRARPLASANSINVGRLLPQIFYYFHLVAQLPEPPTETRPLLVSTPSGNFGNLTAGLMAKRLGLPVQRFIAATNANDVVPEYLAAGVFRPRPSRPTLSNAMDVGDPSNLRRIRHLYGDDLERLRADLVGIAIDDDETLETIRTVRERYDYLLDPHSAVGWRALEQTLEQSYPEAIGAALATAHPAKFADTVTRATGETVSLPPALTACLERTESVVEIEADYGAFEALLRDRAAAPSVW